MARITEEPVANEIELLEKIISALQDVVDGKETMTGLVFVCFLKDKADDTGIKSLNGLSIPKNVDEAVMLVENADTVVGSIKDVLVEEATMALLKNVAEGKSTSEDGLLGLLKRRMKSVDEDDEDTNTELN